jgi:biotin synthase
LMGIDITEIIENTKERDDLIRLLSLKDEHDIQTVFNAAYDVKKRYVGATVYYRGIVELSNICEKDCYYCGIRRSNRNIPRYLMDEDEIVRQAMWAYKADYGSVVLQSGEIKGENYIELIDRVVKRIKNDSNGKLGVTLSLGEQTEETYRRWYDAGAHRYLIRIETSNSELYAKLHPSDHVYDERVNCLYVLKKLGYYTGTGVMIGLPGQTESMLADDILFFKKMDVDMIGMGPYLPHHETPMGEIFGVEPMPDASLLQKALLMIAVTRIFLKDVNIASTTALQSLDAMGREKGLKCGANIIMPNITDTRYRSGYQLYDNKPCLDENASMCRGCLESRISTIGEKIGYGEWGDSPHHAKK